HGTHEFYRVRAAITQELIERHGFAAVVVEADWPDAYRVNRWVRGTGADRTPEEALAGFERFPTWMWRNHVVAEFIALLREHNASVVLNAERYYRTMFSGRAESWNLRDTHMVETLVALDAHLGRDGRAVKLVVWAHNSHLGDARATHMGRLGELNVGQLVRERYGHDALSLGFTTHVGTVTAASDWDGPSERKRVRPSLEGSYERLFHQSGVGNFLLALDKDPVRDALIGERLERAIGVIYLPETERASHYFGAALSRQFDFVIHFDETTALEPLERWAADESPE